MSKFHTDKNFINKLLLILYLLAHFSFSLEGYTRRAHFIRTTTVKNTSLRNTSHKNTTQKNTTQIMLNNTTAGELFKCTLQSEQYILICLYVIVVFAGILGNGFICYVLTVLQSKSKSTTETLLLYLAITDFLSSLWTPCVFIYWILTCESEWHFGKLGCKLIPLMSRVFINISVGIILILAVDRCRAICQPFIGQFNKRCVHLSIFTVVMFSFVCEIYYIEALTFNGKVCQPIPKSKYRYHQYTIGVLMSRDLLYFIIFSATTFLIGRTLWKRDNFVLSTQFASSELSRIVHMVVVMQVVFLILVIPRDMLHVVFAFSWLDRDGIPYTRQLRRLNEFLKVVQTSNSCANVFIYSKLHDRFRKHFNNTVFHIFHENDVSRRRFSSVSEPQLQGKRNRGLSTGPLLEEVNMDQK